MKKLLFYIFVSIMIFQTNQLFSQYNSIKNIAKRSSITGFVKTIYNGDIETTGSNGTEMAQNYLKKHRKMFGLKENISDLVFINSKTSSKTQHLFFKQYYNGIEVINSGIVVSINKRNKISSIYCDYFQINELDMSPSIAQINAENIAKGLFNEFETSDIVTHIDIKIYGDSEGTPHIVYVVSLNLARSMTISLGVVIIDGNSGIVLEKRNAGSGYITGSGTVFDPDPGTYFRDATLTAVSNIDSAYKIRNLTNMNDPISGVYSLKGKYASSNDYLGPLGTTSNTTGIFNFTRNQPEYKEVNVYYFLNEMQVFVTNLGFDPRWKNNSQAVHFDATVYNFYGNLGYQAMYFAENEQILFGFNDIYPTTITGSDDLSVIIHEYGHALHDALISGRITTIPEDSDSEGIGEGIGDYLAVSFRRTLPNGDYRPNEASNYFLPNARTSIKNSASANYSS